MIHPPSHSLTKFIEPMLQSVESRLLTCSPLLFFSLQLGINMMWHFIETAYFTSLRHKFQDTFGENKVDHVLMIELIWAMDIIRVNC